MMHRDDSARRPSGKDLVNLSRVIPEISGDRDGFAGEDASECGIDLGLGRGQLCRDDLKIEQRWLIDPNQLLLGPKIGEGGHAKVYEGLYKSASVAVKIVHPGGTAVESARRRERFLREIEMLSRVQHENLVTFIGACNEANMVIVTELLLGGSLRKYLRSLRPGCLQLRLAISFALDIARAMECLHANGIIHRDLKPDNLLLTQDHKKVKLADFGLAREETLTEMMTAETGTYRWMAPELYSTVTLRRGDKKHYDHKVDVYSFAIVLWELLTNRSPFEGMSNLQAAYAAAFKKVRPDVENLPKELVAMLECCWAEDPNSRPEFQQIIQMLCNFRASICPSETTPPPIMQVGQSSYMATDSPGTRRLMDKSQENDSIDIKPDRSSRFFGCFNECFSS
ncbi:serine/threonine/tyrosine-protein kinase HT1-like [Nymphaea colorata]|nr:serine/threonine/tyrosine-protein kinase HT1-like [Nymphaea colorata]